MSRFLYFKHAVVQHLLQICLTMKIQCQCNSFIHFFLFFWEMYTNPPFGFYCILIVTNHMCCIVLHMGVFHDQSVTNACFSLGEFSLAHIRDFKTLFVQFCRIFMAACAAAESDKKCHIFGYQVCNCTYILHLWQKTHSLYYKERCFISFVISLALKFLLI